MEKIKTSFNLRIICPVLFLAFVINSFSQNGVTNWSQVFTGPAPVSGMAYGNGTFVGVGGGLRFISHDGSNWTAYASPPILNPAVIVYGNGLFISFGTSASTSRIIYQSTNGLNWSPLYTNAIPLVAAAYGNGTWVFIGTNDLLTASVNSPNWNWSEYQPSFYPNCITYANGAFVLVAELFGSGYVFSSSDGVTWQFVHTFPQSPNNGVFGKIVYGNGVYVANGYGYSYNTFFTSVDLANWTTNNGLNQYAGTLVFGGGQFVYSGFTNGGSGIYSSLDGYSWAKVATTYLFTTNSFITFGQGTFIGSVGNSLYQSGLVAPQTNLPPANLKLLTYPGITINGTPGLTYQIQYSTSLNSNWQTLTNFSLPYSPYLWIDTSSPVSGQRFYRSVQLQ